MGDERARVPFSLVGVVLLLGSATFAVSVQPARPPAEPAVDVAMERGTAETTTALRASVRRASDAAARQPVLARANTSVGRVLNDSRPFRDALRVRIYLRARDRLHDLDVVVGDVTVSASLPPTPNASALRAAKRRVHIDTVEGNRTAVHVRVENVTVTARRGNRTVGHRERTASFVVRTPVVALHERVERFEARLNAGLERPGFGRRFTGYTYALTWARGYAQYGGVPVENVVGSGHLGVLTNGAVLGEQRAVFGRSDAAARHAFGRAAVGLAVSELSSLAVQGSSLPAGFPVSGPEVPDPNADLSAPTGNTSRPSADDEMGVTVSTTADRALTSVAGPSNLSAVLREAYTAEARATARIRAREGDDPDRPDPPTGDDWTLEQCETETDVTDTDDAERSPRLFTPENWHVLTAETLTVDEERTRTCEWTDGSDTETEENTETVEYGVDVGVLGRHTHTEVAPDRPLGIAHNRTDRGPYPGTDPNFAGVRERAIETVVADRGGPGALAARHVEDRLDTGPVSIVGERPSGLDRWVRRDLVSLTGTVRNVSTSVGRGRVGTFEANPAGQLATALDSRQARLVDAPARYATVAQRARVAARRAYVEEAIDRLESRRDAHRDRRAALDGVLGSLDAGSVDLLSQALAHRTTGVPQRRPTTADGVTVTGVDGSPAYLTTSAVRGERVESLPSTTEVHPLAARNVNVFTNPYGDITDALLGEAGGSGQVSFRTAARALAATETAAALPATNETRVRRLAEGRTALREAVTAETERVEGDLAAVLTANGVGSTDADRAELVDTALLRWETAGARAVALTNGSAADALASTAVPGNATRQALLEARLRTALEDAIADSKAAIPRDAVDRTTTLVRERVRERLRARTERAVGRGVNRTVTRIGDRLSRSVNRVPAGLPVVPLGTPWWTTVNVWYVEVRGGYDRFAVSARRGSAGQPSRSLTYVRDGASVRVDYDDDGSTERLGRAERVAFSSRTAVGIAVPTGPQGVGDKDGKLDERSAGWDAWAGLPNESRQVPWADGE
ncbi:DUF7286 family protein [Halorientalis litorea]|uniref:DUF7286 family protein n=1 Tax=Halorientalis litorea TaxID=2931977 RepID=UPI001FF6F024|nr:hypothetical protein [Halorientalis litorea]